MATPRAIADIQEPLRKRLLADGAELQLAKCTWHTNGGAETRSRFPANAKTKHVRKADGSAAYGMVMDGAAIGDKEFVESHCKKVTDGAIRDLRGIEKALLLPGKKGETHRSLCP